MDEIDIAIVGAGVIGLAIGRRLAECGYETVILEQDSAIGTGISSRNSEVIHGGLYYAPHSLKAELCVKGRGLLYDYCVRHNIPHLKCGKLIVAGDDREVAVLEALKANAEQCGVGDLRWLDRRAVKRLEPQVAAEAALLSPSTGIVDGHQLMVSLQGRFQDCGGIVSFRTAFLGAERDGAVAPWRVRTGGTETFDFVARWIINAGGLAAQTVARSIAPCPGKAIPARYLAKGHYFALAGAAPFQRLIYPVPEPGGLGIHATLDMGGQVKFGPDVEWMDDVDFSFDDSRRGAFIEAIRNYYPGLDAERLVPGYTGIRPKLNGPGEPAADFRLDGPPFHGVPGLVNLFGIESPGLTASLAIADKVADMVQAG